MLIDVDLASENLLGLLAIWGIEFRAGKEIWGNMGEYGKVHFIPAKPYKAVSYFVFSFENNGIFWVHLVGRRAKSP